MVQRTTRQLPHAEKRPSRVRRVRLPATAHRQTEHSAVSVAQSSTEAYSQTANLDLREDMVVVQEPSARPHRSPNDPEVQAALARISAVLWRGFMAIHQDGAPAYSHDQERRR